MERNDERVNDFDRAIEKTPRNVRDLDTTTSKSSIDAETGDAIGEGVGGVSGALAGAALGSLGGPIGSIIGGIAGAATGWWAGHEISEAAREFEREDGIYRQHYEISPSRLADRPYEDMRPAYQLGYLASRNPDYRGRSFEEIEPELRRGWTKDVSDRYGDWNAVSGYVREVYLLHRDDSRGVLGPTDESATADASGRAARRDESTPL